MFTLPVDHDKIQLKGTLPSVVKMPPLYPGSLCWKKKRNNKVQYSYLFVSVVIVQKFHFISGNFCCSLKRNPLHLEI